MAVTRSWLLSGAVGVVLIGVAALTPAQDGGDRTIGDFPAAIVESGKGLAAASAGVLAVTAELRQARETKDLVAKAGQWSSRRFNTDARSWQVQLERDRNTGHITGSIRANGSYLLAGAAKVDGQLTGSSVSGVVVDAAGNQLATFTGTASAQGMSGTYVTSDGDDGEWSYTDPEPVSQAASETSDPVADPLR